MPKVNVYLPDRLAEAVRAYQIPLSSVCQQALEREVSARLPVLALTPRVRRVLALATKEAETLGHDYVGTEHLLLGLLADAEGIAAQVLAELGVAETATTRVHEILASEEYATPSNRCLDDEGNLIGYMLRDEEGNAQVVDLEGKPVRVEREEGGAIVVLDEAGNPRSLEPAAGKPLLVRTDDEGNIVVLIDEHGRRRPV